MISLEIALFLQPLENSDILDGDNEVITFCPFLPRITTALWKYEYAWNSHPMSAVGNVSPSHVWVQGIDAHSFAPEAGDVEVANCYGKNICAGQKKEG